MSAISPNSPQIPNPFPSLLSPLRKPHRLSILLPRALADDSEPGPAKDSQTGPAPPSPADPSFDTRLDKVRLKYRSGTGKKAEQRKARKPPTGSGGGKKQGGAAVMLPPVPLRDPVTAGGLKVEFGFSPYSERVNGFVAGLGLAALVLVELGSGKGILSYHAPPIIFIQIYTVAAAAALFIKYDKERISIWPQKEPAPPEPSSAVDL